MIFAISSLNILVNSHILRIFFIYLLIVIYYQLFVIRVWFGVMKLIVRPLLLHFLVVTITSFICNLLFDINIATSVFISICAILFVVIVIKIKKLCSTVITHVANIIYFVICCNVIVCAIDLITIYMLYMSCICLHKA